ncbi:N-acetylmannosamine-6-phosphate 2-epimerase [Listeria weihenstephanensis FSL R9-0317]|uniref:Putative N-acetylmannosamine-6-phosphate 2-epimerase n=1 Tax=Listeria weihenstephanensis TaxID=1006155 RepID=A0A1S7FW80_9LIST|nr:N-acetylmannosamine-6-phosphate 2-epimerase [Listeria weihenstephanensis]AQY51696.1 N-acetylmannosamine-6-phosphate 2-epimerase [Listeria weihenstephanensis]EUJ41291.1 N-acetylmannosamine-6-phosphate 2-epimerase [Listeria weihenstephanensis FSL R9-0317]
MKDEEKVLKMARGLIVSCQALEDEPLHSPYIMAKMALAAKVGGAVGIRANTAVDIEAIKAEVDLPVIGIYKKNYGECPVFITPTMQEVDAIVATGAEIVAMDGTNRLRPDGTWIADLFPEIRRKYPEQLFMADVATLEEAVTAEKLGFDFVAPTLFGYTEETSGKKIADDDFALLRQIVREVRMARVIAEGNVLTPEIAKHIQDIGVFAIVVGGAITRPQLITERFVDILQ